MQVEVEVVSPRLLAAVRREVAAGRVGDVWRPALDQVWAFLRTQPGLRTDGHNIFLYHHGDPMRADFGVEVTREFAASGEVRPVRTPGGEAAVVRHVGPYDGLSAAHSAIHAWTKESGRSLAGTSWEIYGDWNEDPAKLETLVTYLLC
ncbi:MAG TPA: GyrI-like domain-containing protein [Thermoanaerobaculia bacterium]|jgi:effector-binding domain-containing protein|nr:GyrI-like domain-containing protein [Thermoanaerobaculia bacterium]